MAIKDDYIKIRVSKEQKALFKDIAKKKNISMSKFIIVSTEERALREKEKFEGTKSLELRVSELEKKLQEIKLKMESQKACLLYTSPSPRDPKTSRMPSSA